MYLLWYILVTMLSGGYMTTVSYHLKHGAGNTEPLNIYHGGVKYILSTCIFFQPDSIHLHHCKELFVVTTVIYQCLESCTCQFELCRCKSSFNNVYVNDAVLVENTSGFEFTVPVLRRLDPSFQFTLSIQIFSVH